MADVVTGVFCVYLSGSNMRHMSRLLTARHALQRRSEPSAFTRHELAALRHRIFAAFQLLLLIVISVVVVIRHDWRFRLPHRSQDNVDDEIRLVHTELVKVDVLEAQERLKHKGLARGWVVRGWFVRAAIYSIPFDEAQERLTHKGFGAGPVCAGCYIFYSIR